jgi:type II secretory pathway pseudopilin PulG
MKNRMRNRKALTLIELVVVMTILIALAGLLIPTFAAMLTRGHTSTCSTNIGECSKAIQQYQQLYGGYPSNMDALSDGTTLINYLANGAALPVSNGGPGTNQGAGQITGITLTAAEAGTPTAPGTLTNAGLATVQKMFAAWPGTAGGFDPTFNYYADYANPGLASANALTLTAGSVVGGLDPTANPNAVAICQKLNLPLTGRYIVLGIGPRCSMVGRTMQSPPVHFGDTPVLNPEFGYERICAVFEISDTANPNFTTAILVAVGPIHDSGLGTTNDELQNWYQLQQNGT